MRRLGWGLVAVALVLVGVRVLNPATARAATRTRNRAVVRVHG